MDVIEELARWFAAVAAAIGVPSSVVVLQPPPVVNVQAPDDLSWKDIAAPLVALLVGVAALINSQRIQRRTLAHDREMRVRDDAREVLAKTLEDVEEAVASLQYLQYTYPARRRLERDEVRAMLTTSDGFARGLPSNHASRAGEIEEGDRKHGAAMHRLGQQTVQLRLFFDDDQEPLAMLLAMIARFDTARLAWQDDTYVDVQTGEYEDGEAFREYRDLQKKAQRDAEILAQAFGTRAALYVRAEPKPGWWARSKAALKLFRQQFRSTRPQRAPTVSELAAETQEGDTTTETVEATTDPQEENGPAGPSH